MPYYADELVTLYHGDCRDVVPSLSIDAIITDPPYGVGATYGPSYDDRRDSYWEWFLPSVQIFRASAPVVAMTHRVKALTMLTDWDWVLIWNKPFSGGSRIGNSPVLPYWEPIIVWGLYSLGTKRECLPDVLTVNPEVGGKYANGAIGRKKLAQAAESYHPHPKPRELMTRLVRGLTDKSQVVCDPFCGSGTTLDACKAMGQRSIGVEIEERYCEVIAKRLSQGGLSEMFD